MYTLRSVRNHIDSAIGVLLVTLLKGQLQEIQDSQQPSIKIYKETFTLHLHELAIVYAACCVNSTVNEGQCGSL